MVTERMSKNFRLLAAAAWADGAVQVEERELLHDVARESAMSIDEADRLIAEAEQDKERDFTSDLPAGEADRAFLFVLLVRVVAADGHLDPNELVFLKKLGPAFGYTAEHVEMVAEVACKDAREGGRIAS